MEDKKDVTKKYRTAISREMIIYLFLNTLGYIIGIITKTNFGLIIAFLLILISSILVLVHTHQLVEIKEEDMEETEVHDDAGKTGIKKNTLLYYNEQWFISEGKYELSYHGVPGIGKNQWAFISLDIKWIPNTNYRVNSVVVKNDKYYIANINYNTIDWFIEDPDTNNGIQKSWRQIEPLDESYFGYLDGYPNIKDYRANINDVVYI